MFIALLHSHTSCIRADLRLGIHNFLFDIICVPEDVYTTLLLLQFFLSTSGCVNPQKYLLSGPNTDNCSQ